MARTDEEKEALKVFLRERLLIVWRGQVDDWEDGVNWIANKTGYSVEFFEKTIIPYLCDWNRQKDLADAKGKFMAELPNIGPFIRKQKYKNPLPYQFTELKAGIHETNQAKCHCGRTAAILAFGEHLCSWHYSAKYCNAGNTGLDRLRKAYQNRIPAKPEEQLFDYLRRSLHIGARKKAGMVSD